MSMENLGPYSNFHELNQDWFLNEFNKVVAEWKAMQKNFDNLRDAFNDLKSYVQDYFKNLDVQDEVNNKIDAMVNSGYFDTFLNNYFKNLKKRTFIIIGDSYGENPYNYTGGWTTPFKSFANLNEGVSCFTSCVGGSGFSKAGNTNKTFLELLQDIDTKSVSKEDITDILVCGGCNDVDTSYSDLNNAILSFRNYAIKNFPNARIYISMIGNFIDSNKRLLLLTNVSRSYATASNYGLLYVDSMSCLHRYDLIGEDGIHPTSAGCINIGRNLYNALYCGVLNQMINYHEEPITSTDSNITISANGKIYGFANNGNIYFGCNRNFVLTFNNTINITNSFDLAVGVIKYSTLFPSNTINTLPINIIALTSTGNITTSGYLYANKNNGIELHIIFPTATINNCKQLQILPFNACVIF